MLDQSSEVGTSKTYENGDDFLDCFEQRPSRSGVPASQPHIERLMLHKKSNLNLAALGHLG